MMRLKFELDEAKDGHFTYEEAKGEIFQTFFAILKDRDFEHKEQVLDSLKGLLKDNPQFIDVYNAIGWLYFKEGYTNDERAYKYFSDGYKLGADLIPAHFKGKIEWTDIENRPFLRLMQSLGLYYMRERQPPKAVELFEKLLIYNPGDNQGVRFIIGDTYYQLNELEKAFDYFQKGAGEYPPCRYNLALLLFRKGEYLQAITQLRLAFIENIYILEYINNKTPLIEYNIYYESNHNRMETAREYFMESLGTVWLADSRLKEFMISIFNDNKVRKELQEIYYLRGIIPQLHDYEEQKPVFKDIAKQVKKVSDKSSQAILNRLKI